MKKNKSGRQKRSRRTPTRKESFSSLPPDFWWEIRLSATGDWQTIGEPFTTKWKKFWRIVAGLQGSIHERGKGAGEKFPINPGASQQLRQFEDRDGFFHLKALADLRADANHILSLFITYLWNDKIKLYDRFNLRIRASLDTLRSLPDIMAEYNLSTAGGQLERNVAFERAVYTVEKHLEQSLSGRDFSAVRHSPPRDKENRVIFTVHEHLKRATGQPRWQFFLNLLIAAGVIESGKKKRRPGTEELSPTSEPSRLIVGRIRSFKNHHPREVAEIERLVSLLYPSPP